jgi:mitochondrial pyruvate carrier 2
LSDLRRSPDQLSISQSASLAATGLVWSRYSLVIIPKNYSLFSVNVFVATLQCYQLYRAYAFQRSNKKRLENNAQSGQTKVETTSLVPEANTTITDAPK